MWNNKSYNLTTQCKCGNTRPQVDHDAASILNRSVNLTEISKLVNSAPPDKSPGMDGITNRMLQGGGDPPSGLLKRTQRTGPKPSCNPFKKEEASPSQTQNLTEAYA